MKYIDTHAHLNFDAFHTDFPEVLKRTVDSGVRVINIGTGQETSQQVLKLAEQYEHFYAIVGLHPIHTVTQENEVTGEKEIGEIFDRDFYRQLAQSSSKVVGIGECGFDYVHNEKNTKEIQEKAFRVQIELALELNLPLMLHIRASSGTYDAHEETLDILKEYKKDHPHLRGQAHFFAGTLEIAQQFIDLGFYISFTGVITFAKMYTELVAAIPLDRILSETDAPYVAPVPYRGTRNESLYVVEVVKKIAEIKNIPYEELAEHIMKNAQRLYTL